MNKFNILFRLTLFLFIGTTHLFSSDLKITPDLVKSGDTLKLSYISSKTENPMEDSAIAILYCFKGENSIPVAYDLPLLKVKKEIKKENLKENPKNEGKIVEYSSRIKVPDSTAFILIKIYFAGKFDTKGNDFWDIVVYDNNKKPIKNGNYFRGISYLGSMAVHYGRNANLELAMKYIEQEINSYKDNAMAEIAVASLKFDLKKTSKEDYKKEINSLVNKYKDSEDENVISGLAGGLKRIGEEQKANKLIEKWTSKRKNSTIEEELVFQRLSKMTDYDEFVEASINFLNKFKKGEYREKVLGALALSFMQMDNIEKLKELARREDIVEVGIYSRIGMNLINNKDIFKSFTDSERYETGIFFMDLGLQKVNEGFAKQKNDLSDLEWTKIQKFEKAKYIQEYGQFQYLSKKFDKALEKYFESKGILEENVPVRLYENIIENLLKMFNDSLIINYSEEAILDSRSSDYIDSVYKLTALKKMNGPEFKTRYDSLNNEAKKKRIENLKMNMLNREVIYSVIQTADDLSIDLKAFKGKVVVINFWSTWCNPCKDVNAVFEFINDSLQKYKDLMIFSVNEWERDNDKFKTIKEYINENEFTLPIYFDKSEKLINSLGIIGLPARLYIDKTGKISFYETGYVDERTLLQEFQDRYELLTNLDN